jgi:hypothetical protein
MRCPSASLVPSSARRRRHFQRVGLAATTAGFALFALPIAAFGAAPVGWSLVTTVDGGTSALGSSISTTGSVAAVGAPFALANGTSPTGAAFIYSNSTSGWTAQSVAAAPPVNGGNFGTSVAAAGNLVAVGAAGTTPNAYVLAADGGSYQNVQTWSDPAGDTSQSFGGSVAIGAADAGALYIAVSAPPGGVYVSRQVNGGAWTDPPAAITNPSAASFGIAIAFAGSGELLVGDPTDAGQVLRYAPLPDGGWSIAGTLPFSLDGGQVHQFGNGIAAWNDLVVVTAPGTSNDAGTYNGVAFVFRSNDAGAWTQEAVLNGAPAETFGNFTAAVNGQFIAIGSAINMADSGAGQVDVWFANGGVWTPVPSSALVGDSYYGQAVGFVGDTLFVGDTSGNGAASISEVTSSLWIYGAVYADAGADAGIVSDGGGTSDGAAPTDGGGTLDGSAPPPAADAASAFDAGATGSSPGSASSSGCGCRSAGAAGEQNGSGALALFVEGLLACALWTRRRRAAPSVGLGETKRSTLLGRGA